MKRILKPSGELVTDLKLKVFLRLISSHILSELHLLATHYGIIHEGELLEQLSAKELNEKCQQHLHIKVDNPNKAATVIESHFSTQEIEVMPDGTIKLFANVDVPREVSKALTNAGLVIEEFMPMGEDLESYFSHRIGVSSMGNLMKTEWYKLRKDRSFRVLTWMLIAVAVLFQ